MKQTAVEWLEEKWRNYDLNLGKSGFNLFLKQSKVMEKEQIQRAFVASRMTIKDAEQYYNETFKS